VPNGPLRQVPSRHLLHRRDDGRCCLFDNRQPDRSAVDGNRKLIYDVRDLVFPKQPGAEPFISLPRLAVTLKEATCDTGGWDRQGWQIEPDEQGYLVVNASQDMQRKVAMVLSDMRRFAVAKQ
jgi:hypothetical protein